MMLGIVFGGIGHNLGKSLVGHFPQPLLTFVYSHLVGRAHFVSKSLWMGCCPYPCTGSPACLQEVVTSGSISPTARSHTHRPYRTSYQPRFLACPRNCCLPSISLLSTLLSLYMISCPPLILIPSPSPLLPSSLLLSISDYYFVSLSEILSPLFSSLYYLVSFVCGL